MIQRQSHRVHNFTRLLRRFGWGDGTRLLLLWLGRQLFHYRQATIYRLALDSIPALECADVQWVYRIDSEDRSTSAAPYPPEQYFVGLSGPVECYTSTVSRTGFVVPERVAVSLRRGTAAYVGDCITAPDFRGRGIYPCGLVHLALRLKSEGFRSLYLFVERDNIASIRSVHRAGFQPVLGCSVWGIGPYRWRKWWSIADRSIDDECSVTTLA